MLALTAKLAAAADEAPTANRVILQLGKRRRCCGRCSSRIPRQLLLLLLMGSHGCCRMTMGEPNAMPVEEWRRHCHRCCQGCGTGHDSAVAERDTKCRATACSA